jgi:hypothetical protein
MREVTSKYLGCELLPQENQGTLRESRPRVRTREEVLVGSAFTK